MSEELKLDRYDVTEGGGTFKCPGGELVYYSDVEELLEKLSDIKANRDALLLVHRVGSSIDQQRISDAANNCESLRARLAKYEDAEGRPLRAVVMPEPLKRSDEGGSGEYGAAMIRGYNACLREVERLNKK